jgi:hypothetical protein
MAQSQRTIVESQFELKKIDKHLAYIEAKTKNTWILWKKMT